MRAVQLFGMSKHYQDTLALDKLSISVDRGTVTALVGPNGAGKTSLLKAIYGLSSFEGDMELFSAESPASVLKPGQVFFLPEEKHLPENTRLSSFLKDIRRLADWDNETSARFDSYLERFGLQAYLKRKIRELSMGMRSALYLSLALCSQAELLLLDEPLTGLDPLIRSNVISSLKERAIDGKTVLYSSHVLEEIEEVADSLIMIHRGRLLYNGSIDSIKERYSEYIFEKPEKAEDYLSKQGVLYARHQRSGIFSLLVDNFELKDKLPAKQFRLKLKEIFLYLVEMRDHEAKVVA